MLLRGKFETPCGLVGYWTKVMWWWLIQLPSLQISKYGKEIVICSKELWCYRLASLRDLQRRQQTDLTRVADELASTKAEREHLEMEQPVLAQKFRYYQELRGYVTDLVECLDEKVGSYITITTRGALGRI